MKNHRPLFWHQGLLLQPQHFQLSDLHSQSLLRPLHTLLEPHFWGVGELEIQEAALGNRSFDLRKGEFLFPDGTYAVFPGNATADPRSFDEAWVEGGKPLTVFIGLKKWIDAAQNVTVLHGSKNTAEVTTRFITTGDPEDVQDMHHTGPPAQVQRLEYVLKIFWETERDQLGDYVVIPLAQLERTGDEIQLSSRFIPPALTISSSGILFNLIKEIRDEIAARAHQLEEYKRQRGVHTAEFGARDMAFLLALRSLNRYAPLLYHFTETKQVHPWAVYGVLRQLVGELSSFSTVVNLLGELKDGTPQIPTYDHWNLWDCFSRSQALFAQLLDEITAGPEYMIELIYDGTYFAADLPPSIFVGGNRYYLVLDTEADPKSVGQSLSTIAKLSSRETLPLLIARSLPAVGLKHLEAPPQELPRRARSIYFQIDHHSDQWAAVQQGNNLALYWDAAPEDLKAELMVVERS